jgi:hypothetical protein
MTIDDLVKRFPDIPQDLHDEPLLAELSDAFSEQLETAQKPSACSGEHDAGNHFYLKLIGPMDIYRYGLYSKERVLEEIEKLVDGHKRDPEGFAGSLLPEDTAEKEVRGPGCE